MADFCGHDAWTKNAWGIETSERCEAGLMLRFVLAGSALLLAAVGLFASITESGGGGERLRLGAGGVGGEAGAMCWLNRRRGMVLVGDGIGWGDWGFAILGGCGGLLMECGR